MKLSNWLLHWIVKCSKAVIYLIYDTLLLSFASVGETELTPVKSQNH